MDKWILYLILSNSIGFDEFFLNEGAERWISAHKKARRLGRACLGDDCFCV
jgi:hypothetical protein